MKSGFVTVAGRPSAGKSTLINRICGNKVSIVSASPQTTRNIVRGIYTEERGQIVFLDTPGYHNSEKKINTRLKELAEQAVEDAEAVLYVFDCTRKPGDEEKMLLDFIAGYNTPVITAVNKIDSPEISAPGEFEDYFHTELTKKHPERKSVFTAVSAKTGDGIPGLLDLLFDSLPEGELLYPEDIYTDQDVRFRISEIIREKAINRTKEEIPHSIYVEIADIEMGKTHDNRECLWVRAFLTVESESQKRILIGKGAEKVKAIRIAAKKEIKSLFPYPVAIDLRVKVNPRWKNKSSMINRLMS